MDLRERSSTPVTRHPWETVRARFFSRLIARSVAGPVDLLDVGAGDGYVATNLIDALPTGSTVTCLDSEYTAEHFETLGSSTSSAITFARTCPDREFDAIALLDVLEHVPDDHAFLAGLAARLRVGGLLVISVPAHQVLFTRHDVMLGHHRRYSRRELQDVAVGANLRLKEMGSLFGSLLLPRTIGKAIERARGIRSMPASNGLAPQVSTGVSDWRHGRLVTSAIQSVLEIDARLCELAARWDTPSVGLSVWALCERIH